MADTESGSSMQEQHAAIATVVGLGWERTCGFTVERHLGHMTALRDEADVRCDGATVCYFEMERRKVDIADC